MKKLGLGCEKLTKHNPRLIYAAITGYGPSGPYAEMPGHDLNYVAMSGLLDLISAPNREPAIPQIRIADLAVGSSQIVIGILLALQERERSGRGQRVDVSLAGAVASLLALPLAELHAGRRPGAPGMGLLSGAYACYNLYRAKNGRWMALGALEAKFWANICCALRCPEFVDQQFARAPDKSRMKKKFACYFRNPVCKRLVSSVERQRLLPHPRANPDRSFRGTTNQMRPARRDTFADRRANSQNPRAAPGPTLARRFRGVAASQNPSCNPCKKPMSSKWLSESSVCRAIPDYHVI